LLLSECRSSVALTHLENVLPVAVIDIESPEATGIVVLAVITYTALFIITATEPVPSMFAVNVDDPVTNTAVAVMPIDAVADTVLLNECIDGVSLIHLENVIPVAVMDTESPEAIGMTVLVVIVWIDVPDALVTVTATEPVPSMFADSV
jgi:hypothetical protein